MDYFQSIILGITQGLTEFLPVSSSGHLILISFMSGWTLQSLTFDVLLHASSSLAVLIYFYKDWLIMLKALYKDILVRRTFYWGLLSRQTKLFITILVVNIPVGIVALIFEDKVESLFRDPKIVAIQLILVSLVMLLAEYYAKSSKNKNNGAFSDVYIPFKDALIISISQTFALIPGTSRSGVTLSTGLALGMKRVDIAKFSFLLATPLIIGASVIRIARLDSFGQIGGSTTIAISGILTAFIASVIAIRFLISYLKTYTLNIFIVYRIVIGVIVLVLAHNV